MSEAVAILPRFLKATDRNGQPVILIGINTSDHGDWALVIDVAGNIRTKHLDTVQVHLPLEEVINVLLKRGDSSAGA